jgi:hypothetical protein
VPLGCLDCALLSFSPPNGNGSSKFGMVYCGL